MTQEFEWWEKAKWESESDYSVKSRKVRLFSGWSKAMKLVFSESVRQMEVSK